MRVTVKLIGPMIYAAGFSEKILELSDGATTDDLLAQIRIEKDRPKIVTRNGKAVSQADALSDGDRVVISPIYSGG
jgi:molybdopterin converting factor small subunit